MTEIPHMEQQAESAGAVRPGFLVVISGPSGVGKTTVCDRLLAVETGLGLSISTTTRAPRPGEVSGRDYYFVSEEEFRRQAEAGQFLESAQVHGDLYGTQLPPLQERLRRGEDVVLNIDVQGAAQIRASGLEAELIFLDPPSHAELERRLRARRTDSPEVVERRLANAVKELAHAALYDHRVVNDHVDRAVDRIKEIIARRRDDLLKRASAGEVAGESQPST